MSRPLADMRNKTDACGRQQRKRARHRVEINANPHRLELDWRYCKRALERGVKLCIGPDAHRIDGIDDIKYGVGVARKGWLTKSDVVNCLPAAEFLLALKR